MREDERDKSQNSTFITASDLEGPPFFLTKRSAYRLMHRVGALRLGSSLMLSMEKLRAFVGNDPSAQRACEAHLARAGLPPAMVKARFTMPGTPGFLPGDDSAFTPSRSEARAGAGVPCIAPARPSWPSQAYPRRW